MIDLMERLQGFEFDQAYEKRHNILDLIVDPGFTASVRAVIMDWEREVMSR